MTKHLTYIKIIVLVVSSLGYERVHLSLYTVADTPFHTQEDNIYVRRIRVATSLATQVALRHPGHSYQGWGFEICYNGHKCCKHWFVDTHTCRKLLD